MTFLSTLASTFFANYIIWLIFRALKLNQGRKIFIITLSIFELGTIFVSSYFLISDWVLLIRDYDANIGDLFIYSIYNFSYIFGVFVAYSITLFLTLSGVKVVKSRRQKRFENELNGKTSVSIKIASIVIIIVGLISILFGILIIINEKEISTLFFTVTIAGILITIFGIVLLILNRDKKEETIKLNNDIILLIKVDDDIFSYKYEYNKDNSFESLVGKLNNDYNLSNFGEIKIGKRDYKLLGIISSDFDYSYILDIKLEKDRRNYNNIIENVSRYYKVSIITDDDLNILNIKKIK